jgi:hypothetical protein
MKLQQHEEHKGEGVAPLKARAETGDLNLFFGGRSIAG